MINLLRNAGFDEAAGPPSETTGAGTSGASAAPGWTTWNNSEATTTTRIIPSTETPGGQVLEVSTTGAANGVGQVFGDPGSGPRSSLASATVFLLRGAVGLGAGDGGDTSLTAVTTVTSQWVVLEVEHDDVAVNEVVIYSASDGDTAFLVDAAAVEEAGPRRMLVDPGGEA